MCSGPVVRLGFGCPFNRTSLELKLTLGQVELSFGPFF